MASLTPNAAAALCRDFILSKDREPFGLAPCSSAALVPDGAGREPTEFVAGPPHLAAISAFSRQLRYTRRGHDRFPLFWHSAMGAAR
jgi:hypothetical protein